MAIGASVMVAVVSPVVQTYDVTFADGTGIKVTDSPAQIDWLPKLTVGTSYMATVTLAVASQPLSLVTLTE